MEFTIIKLRRWYHSLRHLKPVQIYGRLLFFLKRKLIPTGSTRLTRALAAELKKQLLLDGETEVELRLLNKSVKMPVDRLPWVSSRFGVPPEKLWIYNLNYFDWLFDGQTETFSLQNLALILDWIVQNPSARAESWEPFPLSRRIANWARWCELHPSLFEQTRECIHKAIVSQCRRLLIDLEYHNQANHLLENFKGLFVASAYLYQSDYPLPYTLERWLKFSADSLVEQIAEQFLPDGGHYERSPMYHKHMLEAVELVYASCWKLVNQPIKTFDASLAASLGDLGDACRERLPLMRDWLSWLTHPDGSIAQFNDSVVTSGILPPTVRHPANYLLKHSGFFVRRTLEYYFALSCGEPSPPFQPGHSHCDILSYELSLEGRRCIIDTGCGSYQNREIRHNCRRTYAHNLPLIENSEQSDIWGQFRIGKRARVLKRKFDSESALLQVEIVDQFGQKLTREVIFTDNTVRIRDRLFNRRITGTFCSLIHLAPGVNVMPTAEPGVMAFSQGNTRFELRTAARIRTEPSYWYPDFGRQIAREKLVLSNHEAEAIDYVISW